MKRSRVLLTNVIAILTGLTMSVKGANESPATFAVVELFTSEGCSSCPPADKLLAEIAADARQNGKRIYALAYHVDYWNHLGWSDPFSLPEFSKRQQDYARALGVDRIYTPQMIVNGTEEFVGSDRGRAKKVIDQALSRAARCTLTLTALQNGEGVKVSYQVSGTMRNGLLRVAYVESGLVSDVRRGENAGRRLSHAGVVRQFLTVSLDDGSSGTALLRMPRKSIIENRRVIGFVQDPRTMAILGAADVEVASNEPR